MPSQDGEAGLLVLQLDQAKVTKPGADGEAPLGAVVEAIRRVAAGQADGGTSHVTGPAGIFADLVTAFAGIDGILLVVAVLAVLVILFLVYRAIALPFLVLLSAVSALALAGFVVYHLAERRAPHAVGPVPGNPVHPGGRRRHRLRVAAGLAVPGGTAPPGVHLAGDAPRLAGLPGADRGLAGTVIIGLLCLTLSELNSNRSLGPVGAIGIAAAFLAGMTLLPVLLLLGRWVFWPRIPHLEPSSTAGAAAADGRGLWATVARFVGRHPRRIWIITAALLGIACLFVPTLKASGTPQTDVFLRHVDSVAGQDVLAEHFPGGAGNPAIIITPAADAAKVAAAAEGRRSQSRLSR